MSYLSFLFSLARRARARDNGQQTTDMLYICSCFAPIHEIIPLCNCIELVCHFTKPHHMYANGLSMLVK